MILSKAEQCFKQSPWYTRLHQLDPILPLKGYMTILTLLNCNQGAVLTQLQTGHVPLAQHLKWINKTDSPTCAYCKQHNKTVLHYLITCPAHHHTQDKITLKLGRGTLDINNLLSHLIAIIYLLQYIDNTEQLRKTFGQVRTTKEQANKLRALVKQKKLRITNKPSRAT